MSFFSLSSFDDKKCWNTGQKGVLFHEMAHLYDYNKHGITGNDPIFAQNRVIQPTRYANLKGKDKATGITVRPEVLSTVIEQVATGKLREDAQLSNGKIATIGVHYDNWYFTYEDWYNDKEWKPLIREAERILYG